MFSKLIMTIYNIAILLLFALLLLADTTEGFVPRSRPTAIAPFLRNISHLSTTAASSEQDSTTATDGLHHNVGTTTTTNTIRTNPDKENFPSKSIRAPLKFVGPYPVLGLKFPHLATASQRSRNVTGVSLDFVLDTAANTNTISGPVASALDLSVIGEALPGLGAGGAILGGATYNLGDCELEGLPKEEEQFTFMKDLTASALPVASPAAAGLLSLPFFHCFEGGVEFQWGTTTTNHNTDNHNDHHNPPSVTFYGPGESDAAIKEMTLVPVKELPVTRLPSVVMTINGVQIPALLDTGSPITVINAQAAEQAGIRTVLDILPGGKNQKKVDNNNNKFKNPFANIASRFQEAQAVAQAAAQGDVLTIAGSNGERVDLIKSESPATIGLVGVVKGGNKKVDYFTYDSSKSNRNTAAAAQAAVVDFGSCNIYVGNLPGLAALNALGDDSPPAAVLGMDVLRLRPTMLYRARDREVYF